MESDTRRARPLISAGLVALIVVLLLALHFYTPTSNDVLLKAFLETLHFPVFGLVAISVLFLIPTTRNRWTRFFGAMAITGALAVLSEAAQIPIERDASVHDVLIDLFGAASFLLFVLALSNQPGFSTRGRITAILASIVLLVFSTAPLLHVSLAYLDRNRQFPIIFDFNSRFDDVFVRKQNIEVTPAVSSTDRCSSIVLKDGPWPGIEFHDVWSDWSGYTALLIDLRVDGRQPFDLNVRVHDREHRRNDQRYSDRYNEQFRLDPGPHQLRIPLATIRLAPKDRQMNIDDIDGFMLFSTTDFTGRSFCLNEIRLE